MTPALAFAALLLAAGQATGQPASPVPPAPPASAVQPVPPGLGGTAPPATPSPAAPPAPPAKPAPGTCNAAPAQSLVTHPATMPDMQEAKRLSEAARVRIVRPGEVPAPDIDPTRLTIELDEANRIARLRCG